MPKTLAEEAAELRAAIREGHELLRDLHHELKEAKALSNSLQQTASAKIDQTVRDGLQEFGEHLGIAIAGTEAVFRRFDTLAAICLGEDAVSIASGERTIEDILRAAVKRNRAAEIFRVKDPIVEEPS